MKVQVTIVDTKTGITQFGTIEEPVQKGFEEKNAIAHFVSGVEIEWEYSTPVFKCGKIKDTTKVISMICYDRT